MWVFDTARPGKAHDALTSPMFAVELGLHQHTHAVFCQLLPFCRSRAPAMAMGCWRDVVDAAQEPEYLRQSAERLQADLDTGKPAAATGVRCAEACQMTEESLKERLARGAGLVAANLEYYFKEWMYPVNQCAALLGPYTPAPPRLTRPGDPGDQTIGPRWRPGRPGDVGGMVHEIMKRKLDSWDAQQEARPYVGRKFIKAKVERFLKDWAFYGPGGIPPLGAVMARVLHAARAWYEPKRSEVESIIGDLVRSGELVAWSPPADGADAESGDSGQPGPQAQGAMPSAVMLCSEDDNKSRMRRMYAKWEGAVREGSVPPRTAAAPGVATGWLHPFLTHLFTTYNAELREYMASIGNDSVTLWDERRCAIWQELYCRWGPHNYLTNEVCEGLHKFFGQSCSDSGPNAAFVTPACAAYLRLAVKPPFPVFQSVRRKCRTVSKERARTASGRFEPGRPGPGPAASRQSPAVAVRPVPVAVQSAVADQSPSHAQTLHRLHMSGHRSSEHWEAVPALPPLAAFDSGSATFWQHILAPGAILRLAPRAQQENDWWGGEPAAPPGTALQVVMQRRSDTTYIVALTGIAADGHAALTHERISSASCGAANCYH